MLVALIRPVSRSIARCELTYAPRSPIDASLASQQHDLYASALRDLGVEVARLPRLDDAPDAVFVEDCAVVLDEIAILGRTSVASRSGEHLTVAAALRAHRPLVEIRLPGTLEGGDILRCGRTLYAGRSTRTNDAGIEQLQRLAVPHGYEVIPVDFSGCLHLKSACTTLPSEAVLINPEWVDPAVFDDARNVCRVPPGEPRAANVLAVGETVLLPAGHPSTSSLLMQRGYTVRDVDMSELAKAEGGLTCSSIVFTA